MYDRVGNFLVSDGINKSDGVFSVFKAEILGNLACGERILKQSFSNKNGEKIEW